MLDRSNPLAATTSRERGARVRSLDGLRGYMALIVMLAHFGVKLGHGELLPLARLCVYGFFLTSSYALTLSWRGRYFNFVVKRLLRLWPAYAAAIAAGGWVIGMPPRWPDFFWFPFRTCDDYISQDPVVWSLYLEVYASFCMIVIVPACARIDTTVAATAAVILATWAVTPNLLPAIFFIAGSYARRMSFDFAFFNSALAQALGRISYSLYLTHCVVILFLERVWPETWSYLALPCIFVAAAAFYGLIERPSLRLSRNWEKLGGWGAEAKTADLLRAAR